MDSFDYPNFAKYEVVLGEGFENFADGEPCILGVDEAGRGPVLGPMVYGLGVTPMCKKERLTELEVDDSKALTESKREKIFNIMNSDRDVKQYFTYRLHVISPRMISCRMMMDRKGALNEISHTSCIDLIKSAIDAGINVKEVYVDTVGPKDKYQSKLQNIFKNLKIIVAEKADSKYPIVSAASIAAKVTRDKIVYNWKFIEGSKYNVKETGSGYPGDPKTKKYLSENCDKVFGFTSFVRFSWGTANPYIEKNCCKINWDPYNTNKTKSKLTGKRPALTLDNFFTKPPSSKKAK
uniref:Ribonuclease n=1 Tax=Parastrongyloides trichosuri TaxID=131310 RepID=A0A0N5A533_PARTI